MLDISIKPLTKLINRPEIASSFIKKHVVATEKIDGTKLTLIRNSLPFNPNDYTKNWIISYKSNIIYSTEFLGLEGRDSEIKRNSIGVSQYKFVHDHLKKVHVKTASIPCNTEFFLEFVQNKPTVTRDYEIRHGLYLIGFGPTQYVTTKGYLYSSSQFSNDIQLFESYRKLLQLNYFPKVFDGSLISKNSILKGCANSNIRSLFVRHGIETTDFSNSMSVIQLVNSVFSHLESSLGGQAEGVVLRVEGDNALIKILSADQHDKEVRLAKKARYKGTVEEETFYWNSINKLVDSFLTNKNFLDINQSLGELSRMIYESNCDLSHSVKSKINIQEDIFLTAKLRIIGIGAQNASKIAIIPMAAKPYHIGHDSLIQQAVEDGNDSVVVLISTKGRDELSADVVIPIWKNYYIPGLYSQYSDKITIRFSDSPMRDVILIVQDFLNRGKNTTVNLYGGVDSFGHDDALQRVEMLLQKNPEFNNRIFAMSVERSRTKNISGTKMRQYLELKDDSSFMINLPKWLTKQEKVMIWRHLSSR